MEVRFIGVGEAWDRFGYNTTSILVDDGKTRLLLDCGFTANLAMAEILEDEVKDFNFLDGIFMSHHHTDHRDGILGLGAIMSPFDHNPKMKPRTKLLTVIGPEGIERSARYYVEEAHRGLFKKYDFDVRFLEVAPPYKEMNFGSLKLNFAPVIHDEFRSCLAIKVSVGNKSIAYSGDGYITNESKKLYDGVDLLIHEAYSFENPKALNHGTIVDMLKLFNEIKIGKLAFVHTWRYERAWDMDKIKGYIDSKGLSDRVLIPEEKYRVIKVLNPEEKYKIEV